MSDHTYWDEVLSSFLKQPGRLLWRDCRDSLYADLLSTWLGHEKKWANALKTDLFDEAVSDGLFPRLSQIADKVHGLDVSPEVVSVAEARHPNLVATCGDARLLPYEDESFDLVFSNSTLDHFQVETDLEKSIQELHRVLRPNGALVITLDNLDNPLIAARRVIPLSITNKLGLVPFFPGFTLNGSGLRRMLMTTGFSIDSERTFLHAPRVLACKLAALIEGWPTWFQVVFKNCVVGLESLEGWPGSRFTGHYVAALALKPGRKLPRC